MRRGIMVAVIACGLCSEPEAYAQEHRPASLYTANLANGRYWKILDSPSKLFFVRGIDDGIAFLTLEMNLLDVLDSAKSEKLANEFNPNGEASYEELIQQIDAFYADAANANLPVVFARHYVVRKLNGYSPKELDGYAAALRLMFSKITDEDHKK